MHRTLYVATNNRHKLEELRGAFGDSWRICSAHEIAPGLSWNETGKTFLENARIKARALKTKTQDAVLADDSGLIVDALGGRPGVWSSSFGGVEGDHARNNARLLKELSGIPLERRSARFFCCLVLLTDSRRQTGVDAFHGATNPEATFEELIFEGTCEGRIALEPSGFGGFGYDPLFEVPIEDSTGKTIWRSMASLSPEEKNQISHRGKASQRLRAWAQSS